MVRSGENAAKRALVGVRSAALAGSSVLALIVAAGPAMTNELIDGGDNEVVDGNGPGTRPHPWEIVGDLYIARSGAGSLTIQQGGSVNNREAIIGAWNGSTGTVTVTGGGSTWNNSGDLRVGDEGAGSLIVQDGGSVRNKWGYIGLNAGSSGTVTVTGADSTWTSTQILFTGYSGTGNLTVAAGGTVRSLAGTIGMLAGSDGTANVTGADSTWANSSLLTIGFWGKGTLNIGDGGTVRSNFGRIGNEAGATGVATVTGTNSAWINGGNLFVGNKGDGVLNISDGGSVSAADVTIATATGSKGTLNLDGGVLTTGYVKKGDGTGSFAIDGGILRAARSEADFLHGFAAGEVVVETGGAFIDSNGFDIGVATDLRGPGRLVKLGSGTLTLTGDNSYGTGDADGIGTIVRGGTLAVNGGTIGHSNADLLVGQQTADDATLVIRNGGTIRGLLGIVGDGAGSIGRAVVSGANSTWASSDYLAVGHQGTGSLTVEKGALVSSGGGFIGEGIGSSGAVTVTGPGSRWTNSSNLTVGGSGQGELTVSGGGTVDALLGVVGGDSDAIGKATVAGDGSIWNSSAGLIVGDEGHGELTVANRGTVSSAFGNVGDINGAVGLVTVTGEGSHWRSAGVLIVADSGTGTVTIAEGGAISSLYGDIGSGTGSNGTATVTGSGSAWANSGGMFVGNSGSGELIVSDGGSVSNTYGGIGFNAGASGKVKVVGRGADGRASTWINSEGLDIGFNGSGEFTISDGGKVSSLYGTIGVFAGSTGTVTVTGGNVKEGASAWNTTDYLAVGSHGSGELIVSSGGSVTNTYGVVGMAAGSTGVVAITGEGSTWTNANRLAVGFDGIGDLTITDGGTVLASDVLVAADAGAKGMLRLGGTANARGLLETTQVAKGDGDGTMIFDGGVLRAAGSQAELLHGFASGDILLLSGGAFVDSNGFDIGTRMELTGPGGLTKLGSGKLVLSGMNAFQGGTNLLGGTVEVSQDRNLGATEGGLVFDSGTLATTASFASARPVTLIGSGTFDVAVDTALGLIGTIVGTGDLVKTGGGTLTLTGANAYGDTLVQEGSLVGSAGSISGDIGNAGTVVFDQAIGASFKGAVTGIDGINGRMIKEGAGALTLRGPSSLDWTINAGSLVTAVEGFTGNVVVGAQADLVFDQSEDASYAGIISGDGRFIKDGSGLLRLTGDNTGFSGRTTIAGGALVVGVEGKGTLGGVAVVGEGAMLGGSGSVGTIAIAAGGTISPGNSIGTLAVSGDLALAAGSTYQAEVDGTGNSDRIAVTGAAAIAGGTVKVVAENRRDDGAAYDPITTYTILSAAGGISGAFEAVTEDFAFLSAALDNDANAVRLVLTRDTLSAPTFCLTNFSVNQCATGLGVERLGTGNSLYDVVLGLSVSEAPAAFGSLSGELHASAKTALIEDSRFVRDAATDRLRAAFAGVEASEAPVMAYGPQGPKLAPADTERLASWGRVFGGWSSNDGDGNAASLQRNTGGLLFGVDALAWESWRLGLIAGYSQSRFDADERTSSGVSDNIHLGLYGGTEWGQLGFRSGIAYTWHDIESRRTVSFSGFSDALEAGYDAGTFQAFGELGYRLDTAHVSFEPFANLAHVELHSEGYTEAGGAARLNAGDQSTRTNFATLGLRAASTIQLGGMQAAIHGAMGWRHALGDLVPLATQAFSNGTPFTVAAVPIARDAAVIEAGLDLTLPNGTLGLSYAGQVAERGQDHAIKATLQLRF